MADSAIQPRSPPCPVPRTTSTPNQLDPARGPGHQPAHQLRRRGREAWRRVGGRRRSKAGTAPCRVITIDDAHLRTRPYSAHCPMLKGVTKMRQVLLLAIAAPLFTGCASQIGAFYNRPVVEDTLADRLSVVSLAADRRTVVVAIKTGEKPLYCAEPPPDTATGLKTDTDSTLKAKGNELGIKDKLETSVTVLAARNAPLDAFRTGLFSLCQFYMNGALEAKQIEPIFLKLIAAYEVTQSKLPATVTPTSKPDSSAK